MSPRFCTVHVTAKGCSVKPCVGMVRLVGLKSGVGAAELSAPTASMSAPTLGPACGPLAAVSVSRTASKCSCPL